MKSFADLPLFATDAEIGAALLGSARAKEWKALAPLWETRGLPECSVGGASVHLHANCVDRWIAASGS